jgi:hypothetical protein
MADVYIGVNRGQLDSLSSITEGATTGSTDIEVHVVGAKGTTREDLIKALNLFRRYILDGTTKVLNL